MEKIKITIEKKQITEFSNAFIFRHKRKAVAIVESSVDFKTCSKIWKYCLFPTQAGGLYFRTDCPENAFLTVKNNLADYCESITGATVEIDLQPKNFELQQILYIQ